MSLVISTLFPVQAFAQQELVQAQGSLGFVQALAPDQIDVSGAGTGLQLAWPEISGATDIALSEARVTLYPPANADTGQSLGQVRGSYSGDRCDVKIPDGPRPIRSLYLRRLRIEEQVEGETRVTRLRNQQSLENAGLRLAVAVEAGSVLAPVSLAVPRIEGNPLGADGKTVPPYTTPPLLDGARYDSYRLTLPDVSADKLWLMLVEGSDPDDFTPVPFKLDDVSVRADPSPLDVSLLDADGAPFYTGSGPVRSPVTVDVRNAVGRALDAALAAKAQPAVTLSVSARTPGKLGTFGIIASGEVQRIVDDKIAVTLEGDPVTAKVPGPPLDARRPSSARADIVIDHAGLRLHEASDATVTRAGGETGPVVSMTHTVWRALPAMALRGEVLRRVGLVGYGLEAATLSLRVLGAGPDGARIAPPDLAKGQCEIAAPDLKALQRPKVHWIDLGEGVEVDQPIGFEVSAVSGRFLWIAADETPRVRLAVAHTLSGGESVQIGTQALTLTGARTDLPGASISGAVFQSAPEVSSAHFLTLTLSRLTLGYAP
jgi:hypothetical protein